MRDHVSRRPCTENILQQESSSFWRAQLEEFAFKPPCSVLQVHAPVECCSMAQYHFWLTSRVFRLHHDHPSKLSL